LRLFRGSSVLPNNEAPLPLTFKLNGYSSAQFGKVPRGSGVADESRGTVQRAMARRSVAITEDRKRRDRIL
jgi:hypothetical protein